ncbi:MAG TPA: DUF2993 domain-containing protein [Cellulomonas sp.]
MTSTSPRRRRGCAIGLVVALVVVVGGAVLADRVGRSIAQDVAADAVRSQLATSGDVQVEVDGVPFLTQLVSGTLGEVHLTVDEATVSGIDLTDLVVTASDVKIREPRSARQVVATATVPLAQIEQTLREQTGWDLTATIEGDTLVATGAVVGIPVSATFTFSAAGTEGLLAGLQGVTLGGLTVDVASLPDGLGSRLSDLGSLTGDALAGGEITDVQVQEDGLRVTAQLQDVDAADL